MLAKEIIAEASSIAPGISATLRRKGYTLLGKGMDMQAWLEPKTGLILKIFGAKGWNDDRAQESFRQFADYCMNNPNNPFLPTFFGWETFEFEENNYMQIRMERLFPFREYESWAEVLEGMSEAVEANSSDAGKQRFLHNWVSPTDPSQDALELLSYLGEQDFHTLWKTLAELSSIANKKRYIFDLHSRNWMLGSDGHIVISDPFYVP